MLKYHSFVSVWAPRILDCLLGQTRTPLLESLRTGLIGMPQQYETTKYSQTNENLNPQKNQPYGSFPSLEQVPTHLW